MVDMDYLGTPFNPVQKGRGNASRFLLCHMVTLAARELGKSSRGRQGRRKLEGKLGKSDTHSYCLTSFFVSDDRELASFEIIQ